ncbi:MAG: GNAT family N-acetyltransferase [Limnochordales bacterium]|nr:GNAT family N-acetyltransferase [Limnochordales bacterium]
MSGPVTGARWPLPIPQAPYLDGPVLLRDGRPAYLRRATPEDLPAVQELLARSSDTARFFRFFHGVAPGDPDAARRLIAPGNEHGGLSLVVTVGPRHAEQLVAVGSYSHTHRPDVAEVAFLVEDAYQGRGIGTLLLERLAMAALEQGLTALEAFVMGENTDMLSVFEASGFTFERGPSPDGWYIQLPLAPTEASVQRMEARDRIATRASLYPFFHPRSVAVIGASRDPASIGYQVLANLILSHYQGPVYPVNPNAPYVMSVPAYPTVLDIPGPVDLAVVAVPQRAVLTVAEQCAQKGVRAMIVLTAGFAETGPAGAELQRQLVDLVRGSGMRMIGPNCLGLIHCHPEVQMNASFASAPARPGSLAMSSQSGALGQAVLEYAHELGIGLSAFVSIGNKADVSSNDLLQWWEEDDQTSAILLYLESFGNPRRFARLARRVSRRKPIVAVKSGRTAAGRRAAGSHTAALASDDAVVDALFQQSGVIRTRTLSEMFDVAALLAHQPLPRGNRVAILTNAGGPAILGADTCEAEGLVVPPLPAAVQAELRALLPPEASVANPVDMIAGATGEDYRRCLEVLLRSDACDAVIAICIPTRTAAVEEVAAGIAAARAAAPDKPVLTCLMTAQPLPKPAGFQSLGLQPVYRFPEPAAMALARVVRYAAWRETPLGTIPALPDVDAAAGRAVCRQARRRGSGWLLPEEVDQVLAAFGLPRPAARVAFDEDEAAAAAAALGYPVAVKLASATLVHKTEWQGVHLHVADEAGVRRAVRAMRAALEQQDMLGHMAGVLVQKMAPEGVDTFAGVTQEPTFGPVIAFGLGGTAVEVLGDVVFRITPLTDRDAHEMVRSIRGFPLLAGFRGQPPADVDAAADVLLRLSRMVEDIPEIVAVDLNPVRLLETGAGALVLDARIRVE